MSDARNTFDEVRLWICRNARELELAQWRYHFEGGSRQAVLDAMALFQNADGGFGHRFESDNWNPASTPYATSEACGMLRRMGCLDYGHPLWQGILHCLQRRRALLAVVQVRPRRQPDAEHRPDRDFVLRRAARVRAQ